MTQNGLSILIITMHGVGPGQRKALPDPPLNSGF